jgi:hypothetical protein
VASAATTRPGRYTPRIPVPEEARVTQLKLMGGLTLDPAVFTQPKPLLLLAYLALEGAQQRRRLAELFWRDGNRMKSLSMTLTRLRQGAGDVVDADERRAWSTSSSDAGELLTALGSGAWERAADLYRGAFLDGVTLVDWGSELEEWVHATREYLAERVQHGLLELAEGGRRAPGLRCRGRAGRPRMAPARCRRGRTVVPPAHLRPARRRAQPARARGPP